MIRLNLMNNHRILRKKVDLIADFNEMSAQ